MGEKAQELKTLSHYSQRQRWFESACLFTFGILTFTLFFRILSVIDEYNFYYLASGFFLGILAADFVSGVVHWAADTWGTVEWPVVGPTLIRSFREHHVDQVAITRHDFVETNGASSMVCIPVIVGALFIPLSNEQGLWILLASFILFFGFFILLTNQIHKWSHQREVGPFVNLLQSYGVIMSKSHHRRHHTPPFDQYYCITTGWLNPLLTKIGFFRNMEGLITKLTGAIPREDDQRLLHIKQGVTDDSQQRPQAGKL